MKVLVVEDDARVAGLLRRTLSESGYAVDIAADASAARWMIEATEYDGVLLDVMLPDGSGIELCAKWRSRGIVTPVLMLTARGAITDRVAGLDGGADDYLTKPFSIDELLARVRALVRRGPATHQPELTVGALLLDPARQSVSLDGQPLDLSSKEFAILETLMRRCDQVVSRFEILEHVWDGEAEHNSNVIDVYIKKLRDKIDRPYGTRAIQTVRGSGYRLSSDEDAWHEPSRAD